MERSGTQRRSPRRRVWLAGLIVVAIAGLPQRAAAQRDDRVWDIDAPGLLIEAVAGWDGTVDRSRPVPVSFLIRNDSDQIVEGHLTLFDPLNRRDVVLGEVVVAPGTVRRFSSIQDLSDWYECFATLTQGEQVLWRRELALSGNSFTGYVNFALFIDDGGRRLQLPGEISTTAETSGSQAPPSGAQGGPAQQGSAQVPGGAVDRPIRCLTVKTWQVPHHPGPLITAQAIVLPENAAHDSLNGAQWRAIAEWLCEGGVLFIHSGSQETLQRLTDSAPLDAGFAISADGFTVRRVGLGAIHQYAQPLFRSEDAELRQRISDKIAGLPKRHITSFLDSAQLYNRQAGRAELNRLFVVGFFLCYAFFSGAVALLLFRATQRRVGVYIVIVVVGASVLSGLLGGYLRLSQGDLRWLTVTQAGAGGLVQVGRIEVQSAGGRDTQVAINGEHADLQFVGGEQRYYYNAYYMSALPQSGYPPFTWQPNLAPSAEDTYQVNVTITPWGRRRLYATAFRRGVRPLAFELEFEPRGGVTSVENQAGQTATVPSGTFSLKLVHHLPFNLIDCWVVIGAALAKRAGSAQGTVYMAFPMAAQPGSSAEDDNLIQVYHRHPLGLLPAGAEREANFETGFRAMQYDWEQVIQVPGGGLSLSGGQRPGHASAWIIGLVDESPILEVDEQRSDFVPQEQLHFFVQEILPEDMPDASLFLGNGTEADPDTGSVP